MSAERDDIAGIALTPEAQARILGYGVDLTRLLTAQAKVLAYRQGDDLVLRRHVEEAYDTISHEHQRTAMNELAIAVGGVLFGTFIPGFITEISSENGTRDLWLSIYVLLGLLGLFLLSWGFMSRR